MEVDEAGKLARFRQRFGGAFDLSPGHAIPEEALTPKEEAATARASSGKGGNKKAEELKKAEGERAAAAEAEAAKADEDIFTDLLSSYVVDQPQLKGGKIAGKDGKKGKKK